MNLDGNGAQNFDDTNRKLKGDKRQALRASIDKAALAVRSRDVDGNMPLTPTRTLTKQERLARNTGSEDERRSTRGTVAAAMEKVSGAVGDTDISGEGYRSVRDALRQRYPGRSLSDMVSTAEQTEAAFKDDPVAARSAIIANYAKLPVENLPTYKPPVRAEGLRGSIRRATQDQADAQDLKAAEAKYGKNLPQILAQLEAFDRGMINDPANTSARLATAYGAPATHEQIAPYQAAQAAKAHKKHIDDTRLNIVQHAIQHGHIPGDEATLNEIAAVMVHPKFQQHPTDPVDSLKRAAAIAKHPNWHNSKRGAGSSGSTGKRDAGSLSIGNSGVSLGDRASSGAARYGNGSGRTTRDAIRKAMAR
jgi:hypothetical protein